MRLSAILAPLIAAKVPHDQIMAVVVAYEAEQADALSQRRKADADRQARKRERDLSRDVTLRHRDRSLTGAGDAPVDDKTSNSEIEPQQEERNALAREFDDFWAEYPNKVGKPKAKAAFLAARKRGTPFAAIMAGLARYVASKPVDRAWLNPATFFNQDRWDDQPAKVIPMARGSPAPVFNLIDGLIGQMDEADANTSAEIEGNQAAPLRLSHH